MTTKSKQLHLVTSVLQVFYYSRASTNDRLSTTATSLQRPLGGGQGDRRLSGAQVKGAEKNAEGGAVGHAQYRSDIQCCELRHN